MQILKQWCEETYRAVNVFGDFGQRQTADWNKLYSVDPIEIDDDLVGMAHAAGDEHRPP